MAITTQTPKTWMDKFFAEKQVGNIEERGYLLRVAVAGYTVTPRDTDFEHFKDMGMVHLEPILHHEPIGQSYVLLVYPERWLSIHEQYMLMGSLDHHPEVKSGQLTAVDILTQNPLIVSNCCKGEAIIFDQEGSKGLTTNELQAIINREESVDKLYAVLS